MRGHNRAIPSAVKDAMGNPGRNKIKRVVDSQDPVGDPPADMTEPAKKKWQVLAFEWRIVLRASHRDALRIYCEAWAEMIEAQERVRTSGTMVLMPNGVIKKSPWLIIVEHRRDFLRKALAEFGGSPSSAQSVNPIRDPDEEDDDPAMRYM